MIINKTICDKDRTDCNGSGYFVSVHDNGSLKIMPSKDVAAEDYPHHYCGIGCLTQALPALLDEARRAKEEAIPKQGSI